MINNASKKITLAKAVSSQLSLRKERGVVERHLHLKLGLHWDHCPVDYSATHLV